MDRLRKNYQMLYPLNNGIESLVIADILNTILVIRGIRKAYLPQHKLTSQILKFYFSPHVKLLTVTPRSETPGNLGMGDMAFVVRADSTLTPPTTQVEIGRLLGYPCADEWDRSVSRLFYEITVLRKDTGEPVQLFAFVCKTEEKIEQAIAITNSIRDSLLGRDESQFEDELVKTLVGSIILRKGIVDTYGGTTFEQIGGARKKLRRTRRRKSRERKGRRTTRHRS